MTEREEALEEAAKIAEQGCLVPPDGGSPTDYEREMFETVAARIRALKSSSPPPKGGEGWRDIETADLELCARAPCLVTADGVVGEARYFPDEDGWWWADYAPTDYLDRRCYPSHWMPLPAAPDGKATPPDEMEK